VSLGKELLLEKIFSKVDQIPTFPKVAQRALELLRNENVDYRKLEEVIKTDPGIAANFLKIVNSALYALPRKVESISQAFLYLGVDQIKFILLSAVVGKYFDKDMIGYGVSARTIWLHSIACGIAGELLARKIGTSESFMERVYLACLLHDIGKIVLDLYTKIEVEQFKNTIKENPEWTFMQVEWLVLGVDHGLVGAELLKRWEFPEDVVFSVRAHHDDSLMVQRKLSAIVALANAIANLIGFYSGIDSFYYSLHDDLLKVLGIKPDELEKVGEMTLERSLLIERELI
jgi:putative nucleotidyltransferase with HDIG domain